MQLRALFFNAGADCALTVNGQTVIMKYRRMIAQKACWGDALEFADKRRASALAKTAGRNA